MAIVGMTFPTLQYPKHRHHWMLCVAALETIQVPCMESPHTCRLVLLQYCRLQCSTHNPQYRYIHDCCTCYVDKVRSRCEGRDAPYPHHECVIGCVQWIHSFRYTIATFP